jgi:hypothetical protein
VRLFWMLVATAVGVCITAALLKDDGTAAVGWAALVGAVLSTDLNRLATLLSPVARGSRSDGGDDGGGSGGCSGKGGKRNKVAPLTEAVSRGSRGHPQRTADRRSGSSSGSGSSGDRGGGGRDGPAKKALWMLVLVSGAQVSIATAVYY